MTIPVAESSFAEILSYESNPLSSADVASPGVVVKLRTTSSGNAIEATQTSTYICIGMWTPEVYGAETSTESNGNHNLKITLLSLCLWWLSPLPRVPSWPPHACAHVYKTCLRVPLTHISTHMSIHKLLSRLGRTTLASDGTHVYTHVYTHAHRHMRVRMCVDICPCQRTWLMQMPACMTMSPSTQMASV